NIERVARRKLNAVHFAAQLRDLTKPPHNRLEALKGEFKGK
ncbi:5222_t:CDS:1, partial [Funneliformis geosporum]